ncbi:TVP38/TMEM64 family protein [Microbulbifer rhizosphaerae]|uniref:Putative membrane protein YdjX (TVP38/TMEM64 family) n=1 Tax=Microbulbifer rhizosphaerae TaxID=1562603 RepID=A0A7W4W925_9GAMM|nr:TVP38/TMEM64 family protein [Microbulbifer rhizosphaerae]MBB3059911.1 putative membrane protein YdjX (TVP38/TMEM64 family) [Microbulbifer rhizosphaerae]
MKKVLLALLLALAIGAFFLFDLHQMLTLEGLKSGMDDFAALRTAHPLALAAAFFAVYVLVTALSLPGAAVLTLAAGALFGFLWGSLIVSFASSLGALLAFLTSRYLLRDRIQTRFGERLQAVNRGVEEDGIFYLFTLRLVPLFPFFLINLLMGLTPIRATTFYWVSQLGMLAGTLVYVNAGTQLAQLQSLSGILSPALLLSFGLLGLFPLLAKKLLGLIQLKRRERIGEH